MDTRVYNSKKNKAPVVLGTAVLALFCATIATKQNFYVVAFQSLALTTT